MSHVNSGTVSVSEKGPLTVSADYRENPNAKLSVPLATAGLQINGKAFLAGILEITAGNFDRKARTPHAIMTARHIEGTFRNPDQMVVDGEGNRFSLSYTDTEVILTLME